MHYCFRGSHDQVIGLKLSPDELGQDIYKILDWADETFEAYTVDQSDDFVYIRSGALEQESDVRLEPLKSTGDDKNRDSPTDTDGDHDGGSSIEPAML